MFDLTTVNASLNDFRGAAFDGRYVYFVPYNNATGGVVARYDTTASFATKAAWSTFDVSVVNANAVGFEGAVFAGRYLYFVPCGNGNGSTVTRYDTTAPFATKASWSTFDVSAVNGNAYGFKGGIFDGRYVYLVPNTTGTAARYDTQGAFGSIAAWSAFDVTTKNAGANGFEGGGV